MHAERAAVRARVAESRRRLTYLLNWSAMQHRPHLRGIGAELESIEDSFLRPDTEVADDAVAWLAEADRLLRLHVEPQLDAFEHQLASAPGASGWKTPSTGPRRRHTLV